MPNCTIIESKIVNENKTFENIFCGMEGKKALRRGRKNSIIKKQVEIIPEIRYNGCAAG